jgi:hypothetical protein
MVRLMPDSVPGGVPVPGNTSSIYPLLLSRQSSQTRQHCRCLHHFLPTCPSAPTLQVPDRQFLLLSAQVLAAAHDWPALQHMAGRLDRKSGLSMDHFIAAARWAGCRAGPAFG